MVNRVGVIALQGGYQRHIDVLATESGAAVRAIRAPEDLAGVGAVVIPGGESTTIGMLMERFGLLYALRERINAGMPVMGTCAGAILLARQIEKSTQVRLGTMDITVERNAYGRQIASFEADISLDAVLAPQVAEPFRAVFIRAPVITATGDAVEVLASFEGKPVVVRQGSSLALTFHPELTGDSRIHRYLLDMM